MKCNNYQLSMTVPGIVIAVLLFDVPLAVLLYITTTVVFPLGWLPLLVKSVVGISRVVLRVE